MPVSLQRYFRPLKHFQWRTSVIPKHFAYSQGRRLFVDQLKRVIDLRTQLFPYLRCLSPKTHLCPSLPYFARRLQIHFIAKQRSPRRLSQSYELPESTRISMSTASSFVMSFTGSALFDYIPGAEILILSQRRSIVSNINTILSL
jgi:hypothetical protein